jgi:pilus assembly protein CpaE
MVTHLLDLVSSHFDHVVIDMPRTWFSWTDNVLLGSNRVFIVSEMTVPAIKHARKLVSAIGERLGDGPNPKVIVNRFEQFVFGAGLRKSDLEQALGDSLAGVVPNDYRTVREAIDRGVPINEVKASNKITHALRPLVELKRTSDPMPPARRGLSRLRLSWAKAS